MTKRTKEKELDFTLLQKQNGTGTGRNVSNGVTEFVIQEPLRERTDRSGYRKSSVKTGKTASGNSKVRQMPMTPADRRSRRTNSQRELQLEFVNEGNRRRKPPTREQQLRRRRKRRRVLMARWAFLLTLVAGLCFAVIGVWKFGGSLYEKYFGVIETSGLAINWESVEDNLPKPVITEDFLPFNEYSRIGDLLPEVNNIFIHYTANPNTTAAQNRSYFASLAETGETSASAHFIIGYDGEIVQCLPLGEIGYAVKGRNYDSISIECCYTDENGQFTEATSESLLRLVAWLLQEYGLSPDDLSRHYDQGGKMCPKYYVENEDAWERLKQDIYEYIEPGTLPGPVV